MMSLNEMTPPVHYWFMGGDDGSDIADEEQKEYDEEQQEEQEQEQEAYEDFQRQKRAVSGSSSFGSNITGGSSDTLGQ